MSSSVAVPTTCTGVVFFIGHSPIQIQHQNPCDVETVLLTDPAQELRQYNLWSAPRWRHSLALRERELRLVQAHRSRQQKQQKSAGQPSINRPSLPRNQTAQRHRRTSLVLMENYGLAKNRCVSSMCTGCGGGDETAHCSHASEHDSGERSPTLVDGHNNSAVIRHATRRPPSRLGPQQEWTTSGDLGGRRFKVQGSRFNSRAFGLDDRLRSAPPY